MASSQHRCVFVGNIPYDATEEQLIQICEEVGPVVSFRLVIDRETGKPKGYGFCEYKDEETALSARRNLQGYEINGRQLRVDFAENDKNTDRNREQGRGGPGMASYVDLQKQIGGPPTIGDSGFYQPIGLQVAMAAASVMAGALGGPQFSRELKQNGFHGQPASLSDPLTLHLAKMSRNQLNTVMSELKVMATQNKEQARQLLLANAQLSKALFQAEIMLGMVTPQMLQMPNIRKATGPLGNPSLQDGQQGLQLPLPPFPGQPLLAQNKIQFGLMPRGQEAQVSSLHPDSLIHSHYAVPPQLPTQPPAQLPQLVQKEFLLQGTFPGDSGVSTLPSAHPPPFGSMTVRPQTQPVTSMSRIPDMINRDGAKLSTSASGPTQVSGAASFVNQIPKAEEIPNSDKQVSQLPPEVESVLLQQVLSLTPEQLSSLPPDQQQQVMQLQQMLRRSS